MDLTHDELERFLCSIFTGTRYLHVDDELFTFKHPSNEIKMGADLVYNSSYNEALTEGMLSIADLEKIMEERNIITVEEKDRLKKLEAQLEGQKILLGRTTRVKANQDRIKGIISGVEAEIRSIKNKKTSKLLMSAETKGEEDRALYLCSRCTYSENEYLVWPTYKDILKEKRLEFKDELLIQFLGFYGGISTRVIRFIARSALWRIRYVTSQKVSDPLFGVPTSQYTNDMLNLAYWSNYYQNIYEMLPEDRPSDLVVEDDDALDAYMKTYYADRTQEDAARKSKAKNSGRLSAFDSEEVIITRSNELYEDIEYDKPREAQRVKDRADIKKRTRRG
jgi:hypothetical protein